jgi:hypothetical protein
VRRTIEELSPNLPPRLGGGSSRVLTEGLQWAALGIDPAHLRADLVIQSSSAAAAKELATHLPKMLKSVYDASPETHQQIPAELSQVLISWLNPTVQGTRVVVRMDGLEKTSVNLKLLAAIGRTIDDRTRRRSNRHRFKQILLAMHNYYDAYGSFAPADKHRGEGGPPHLSWRVYILPFLEEMSLYKEFHLDEPWDSPHNAKLIEKMPDVYGSFSFDIASRTKVRSGHTTFLAPTGEDTIYRGQEVTKFSHILDGTSNTIALVEVKPEYAVPWTAPQDYEFNSQDPAAGLLVGVDGRWLCGFADGSVHQLRGDAPSNILLHLFRMSDGNAIDYSKIR